MLERDDEGGWLKAKRLGGDGATGWIPTAYIEEAPEPVTHPSNRMVVAV